MSFDEARQELARAGWYADSALLFLDTSGRKVARALDGGTPQPTLALIDEAHDGFRIAGARTAAAVDAVTQAAQRRTTLESNEDSDSAGPGGTPAGPSARKPDGVLLAGFVCCLGCIVAGLLLSLSKSGWSTLFSVGMVANLLGIEVSERMRKSARARRATGANLDGSRFDGTDARSQA